MGRDEDQAVEWVVWLALDALSGFLARARSGLCNIARRVALLTTVSPTASFLMLCGVLLDLSSLVVVQVAV